MSNMQQSALYWRTFEELVSLKIAQNELSAETKGLLEGQIQQRVVQLFFKPFGSKQKRQYHPKRGVPEPPLASSKDPIG